MSSTAVSSSTRAATRRLGRSLPARCAGRAYATVASNPSAASASRAHKVVIVGGGTAGVAVSQQLLRAGKFAQDDIAVVDPAEWHHYQPGWTLVGAGLKNKQDLRLPMRDLMDPKLKFYESGVASFAAEERSLTLANNDKISYDQLIVAPGIKINYDSIAGLNESLKDPSANVSTIYGYDTCDKVFPSIQRFRRGNAIFTQPAGPIKCAGAPQKAMWLALDHWKRNDLFRPDDAETSPIQISFATALPVMFGVPKYSATLDALRKERGVEGLFQHDLVEINGDKAVFALADGSRVTRRFDFLHAVPKMGPHAFVAQSPLANGAGFVDVDDGTMQHRKYPNVWSAGDASSLPTSKTAAAVTSQAPALVSNVLRALKGQEPNAVYDGYTSCPLPTEYGKLLLAEFKYGGVPKETFAELYGIDQGTPRKSFYYLKKDFFPWVYKKFMVKGLWAGPQGFLR